MDEYEPGDELYFFGFSRGAYTARSLAGLVRNSGILRPEHRRLVDDAFDLYRDRDPSTHPGQDEAVAFRRAHSWMAYAADGSLLMDSSPIECIGVWDTVGALGIPFELFHDFNEMKYQFHDTTLSGRVRNAFHALAIDERRKPFAPTLWRQPAGDAGTTWLEQAWFTGYHSDVGGGNEESSLSDTTLLWMKDRVQERTGLRFDDNYLTEYCQPDYLGPLNDSMNPFYEAFGPYERKLDDIETRLQTEPDARTWEYVRASADKRYRETRPTSLPWEPPNFLAYIRRADHVAAEERTQ